MRTWLAVFGSTKAWSSGRSWPSTARSRVLGRGPRKAVIDRLAGSRGRLAARTGGRGRLTRCPSGSRCSTPFGRAYDTVAADYAALLADELHRKPWDRATLTAFAELVLASGGGPVLEVGCGPGRITAHLHGLRLDVSGVDLSPQMVEEARRAPPPDCRSPSAP